ncbi:winged helix-turn-helix domain-containing protein [Idiomarina xiamenensis]|uniref:Transcriptional regulatory protein-like protein n=1 Tax=Idiomarina xiamenensis 10-D-4 TaxID=740709 RepID=K2JFQ6_9GAMM|nr:winged helix-turn-helix domain-containing protein [Idiomarina xiamenensis]EKE82126.1 transcriptional regulatory protein-like protein [Idiomarina xiamenensis 10-D-4]
MENEQSLSGKRWLVGDFVVYPEQRVLQTADGTDVAVEPRVVDALILLCQRRGDYVTVDELMADIWQGRVVSDAAVRGAIRKLRTALADSAKDPQYIQSSPKRGYRLIKPVQVQQVSSGSMSEVAGSDSSLSAASVGQSTPTMTLMTPAPKRLSLYWVVGVLLVSIALLVAYQFSAQPTVSKVPASIANYQTAVISQLPGEKYSFDMSADGQWLAFTAKLQSDESYQLYLLNRYTGAVEQLTRSNNNITSISFIGDSNALAYVEMLFQQANLYMIEDVANASSWQTAKVLLENYRTISDIESLSRDGLLLSLGEHDNMSTHLYKLSLNSTDSKTADLVRLSSTDTPGDNDATIRVSPDGQHIAYLTLHKGGLSSTVHVINGRSYQPLYQVDVDFQPQDIAWVATQPTAGDLRGSPQLWLLDGQDLYRLNADTEQLVRHSNLGFRRLKQDVNQQSYLAITSSLSGSRGKAFVIAEVNQQNPQTYLKATPEHTKSLHFLTDQQFIAVVKVNNGYQLQLLAAERAPQVLFESQEYIEVISRNDKKHKVLFGNRQQFFLLDSGNLLVSSITRNDQTVANASFDIDGRRVLYSNKVDGEWQVLGYNLDNGTTDTVLGDYRFVYAFHDRYVALNKTGDLFILSPSFKVIRNFEGETVSYNGIDQEKHRSRMAIPLRPEMLLSADEAKDPANFENLLKPNFYTLESPDGKRLIRSHSTIKSDVIVQLNPANNL